MSHMSLLQCFPAALRCYRLLLLQEDLPLQSCAFSEGGQPLDPEVKQLLQCTMAMHTCLIYMLAWEHEGPSEE